MPRASETTGAPGGESQRFTPADRLKKRYELRRLQLRGRRIHTPHFLIVVHPNALEHTRLGITVTKKVGSAVQRNRIKRVVREVFRRNRVLFPRSHDVVLIAKRNAVGVDYDSLVGELRRAAKKMSPEASR